MDATVFPYLIPHTISLLISCGVAAYAWKRRADPGAAAYAFVAASQASWTFGFILELLSPDLADKIFWDNFQFIGGSGWVVGFAAFALRFTGRRVGHPWLFVSLLSLPLTAVILLAYTDPLHGLVRANPSLIFGNPFSSLVYGFTPVVLAWSIYIYAMFVIFTGVMFIHFLRAHRLYRVQVALVLIGNFVPLAATVLTITVLAGEPYRDITPFTFAAGNLIVAWGLFRYQLFDVLPVARDVIIENLRDPIFVFDSQRRLVDLNPAARLAIDRLDSGVIGQSAENVFAAWPDLLRKYSGIEGIEETNVQIETPRGHRHVELRLQPLTSRRKRPLGYLVISRDITDRIAAEENIRRRTAELEQANVKLEELSRVKDEFVSNVSHELRTPLASMKLNLELVTARPENQDRYLTVIRREIDRLEGMIEGLLALSRLDQDRIEIDQQSVDLNVLAGQYVADRASLAEAKGLTLRLDCTQVPPPVKADPKLIGQALSIFLTNAINYTSSGGSVTVGTLIHESHNPLWVGLSVSDTGPGIPPGEEAKLFSRFFRGSAGRKSGIAGTGLGLALARQIAERFSGAVEVRSAPGGGADFRLWLPAENISSHAAE